MSINERRGRFETGETQKKGHVKTEAEISTRQPPANELHNSPEARRGKEASLHSLGGSRALLTPDFRLLASRRINLSRE